MILIVTSGGVFCSRQFFHDKTWGGSKPSRYNPVEHTHAHFAAMITRLDAFVGQILGKLQEKGLDENTLVIFTSDNGPHEEGGADPTFFGRDGKLRGLKRSCYEGGIRIPFIARWPGHVPAGVDNDHMLAFYDLMPTCRELVGDKHKAGAGDKHKAGAGHRHKAGAGDERKAEVSDGISFVSTLLGDSARQARHDFLYWEFHETDQMAVRSGEWKLYVEGGVPHLFNLSADIHEDNDLASQYPDKVKQLMDILWREHRDSPLFPVTLPER